MTQQSKLTQNNTLRLGEIEKLLLASGLWVISGNVHPALSVSPELLNSAQLNHQLILRAVREKMLPMLLMFMRGIGWKPSDEIVALNDVFQITMNTLYQTIDPVIDGLRQSQVQVLMLKGGDLHLNAYKTNPVMPRIMEDIDLLVKPPDLPVAERVLLANGFRQGRLNKEGLSVTRLSAAELTAYEMQDHYELIPFHKFVAVPELVSYVKQTAKYLQYNFKIIMVGGKAYVPISCDVHFNISRDIDLEDVWHSPRRIILPSGHEMLAQSLTSMLCFLASRLYHEVMLSNHGVIRQFIDVLAIVKFGGQHIDWNWILTIAEKYELRPSLYYVFVHINEFLGSVVPQKVIEACYPARREVSRDHDWGDLMPKLLGSVATTPIL